uniref:Uncharacterized protein n=1 Tax=Caenorhabditis japonica TaxID=281687 RepID=A0A8R1EJD8_CAEJA
MWAESSKRAPLDLLREEAQEDDERVSRYRADAQKAKRELEQLRTSYGEQFSNAVTSVRKNLEIEHEKEISPLREQISKLSSFRFKKKYDQILSKNTKDQRCSELVEYVKEFVGPENTDQFILDFIHYVSVKPQFTFSLSLSDWDTFVAAIHWQLSDHFLKTFKMFLKSRLQFDVFGSRLEIQEMKKKCAPGVDYKIDIIANEKVTKTGRRVPVQSSSVGILHLEEVLSRRLSALQKSGRLRFDAATNDDILIGVAGDKGSEQTKLALIIGNVSTPNDPKGLLLIGFYSGNDDHSSLVSRLGFVMKQVNELKSVTYQMKDTFVTKKVRKIPIGDCKFISSLFHHPGQASKEPCFICKLPWSTHGEKAALVGKFAFHESGKLRTLDELQGEAMIDVEPASLAPPTLHSICGIAKTYVIDPLIAHSIQLDTKCQVLPRELKEQKKILKKSKRETERYEERVEALEEAVLMAERAGDVIEKCKSGGRGRPSRVDSCESSLCLAGKAKKNTFSSLNVFVCPNCSKNVHRVCSFQFTVEEDLQLSNAMKICLDCSVGSTMSLDTRDTLLKQVASRLKRDLEDDGILLAEANEMVTELEDNLQKSSGPTRKKFEEVLRSFGVDQRVWLQEFTGNNIRKILRPQNIDAILAVFPPSRFITNIGMVMKSLAFLMTSADTAAKTDKEMDEIELHVGELVRNLRNAMPDAVVTPKLHLVAAHLVPYLRANRSWGRLTEQSIEALHALFNTLNRRFAAVRDEQLLAQLILQQMSCYNLVFDAGIQIS